VHFYIQQKPDWLTVTSCSQPAD